MFNRDVALSFHCMDEENGSRAAAVACQILRATRAAPGVCTVKHKQTEGLVAATVLKATCVTLARFGCL